MKDQINLDKYSITPADFLARENENIYTMHKNAELLGHVVFDQIEKEGVEFIAWFFMPPKGHLFSFGGGCDVQQFESICEHEDQKARAVMRLYSHLEPTECHVINLYMMSRYENTNKPPRDFKVVK